VITLGGAAGGARLLGPLDGLVVVSSRARGVSECEREWEMISKMESYRSQHNPLNLKSWLPYATEDDVSLVSEALLSLA
jgi:hypothetical protein